MAFLTFPIQEILTASGKCPIHLFQQTDFPSWMGIFQSKEKKDVLYASPSLGFRDQKKYWFYLCCICQLSLMVHFLMCLVISDYKLLSVGAVFLGDPGLWGDEPTECSWICFSCDTTGFDANFSAQDACSIWWYEWISPHEWCQLEVLISRRWLYPPKSWRDDKLLCHFSQLVAWAF